MSFKVCYLNKLHIVNSIDIDQSPERDSTILDVYNQRYFPTVKLPHTWKSKLLVKTMLKNKVYTVVYLC